MTRLPRLVLFAAIMLLAFAGSAPAQPASLYQGPLWDAHSHPIPWVEPPLTVPAVAAMLKEVGTMGVFLNTMNMHVGGADEGARIARAQHASVIYPFLGISGFPGPNSAHWLQQTPVVVLSADATREQIERLLAAGARAYLTKPLDVRQLLALVDELLRARRESG